MAFGDFLDLKQEACYLAQRDPSVSTELTAAGGYVNEEYLRVMALPDAWSFAQADGQVTLTAGTSVYLVNGVSSISSALGYGTNGVEEVRGAVVDSEDASGFPLREMGWAELEELSLSTQDGESPGVPIAWAVTGDRMRIYPSPVEGYTLGVLVRRRPVALSLDADVPLLPVAFCRPILAKAAAAQLLQREGGGEARSEAGQLRAEAMASIQDLQRRYASARRGSGFRVVAPGYMQDLDYGWQDQRPT